MKSRTWKSLARMEADAIDGDRAARCRSVPPPSSEQDDASAGTHWNRTPPARERIGLAFSGGGIRSATFNLGVLQKLDALGVLSAFHYLATVSGGGYVGAFWTAWKSRRDNLGQPFPREQATRSEPDEVRHLREYSNFIRPRTKLLSLETGNIAAGLVGAVLPSVVIALSLLVVALSVWLGLARVILGEPWGLTPAWLLPALAVGLVTGVAQLLFEVIWRSHNHPSAACGGTQALTAVLSVVVAGATWALLWHLVPWPFERVLGPVASADAGPAGLSLLLPSVAWIVAILGLVALRVGGSRWVRHWEGRCHKGALDRTLSRVILCAAAWAVVGAIWLLGQVIAREGLGWVASLGVGSGAGGGLFAWVRKFLGRQPNKPSGGKLRLLAGPWLLTALAYLVLAAVAVFVAALLALLGPAKLPWTALGAFLVVVGAVALFQPEQNGFHALYRQRLVRAYLGASNRDAPDAVTAEDKGDDVALGDLPTHPLHLVCCAANDLAADPLSTLNRGADSAVLSGLGLQVGGSWASWEENGRQPNLGSAITASAAAFNSQMGSLSVRLGSAATFLLGALSLRLGLWLENPASPETRWSGFWASLHRLLPGTLYLRELAGASRARSSWIHLSDGAHFENLALYELIRRHCRCILLCDCGADPDVAFDDFGTAVRRVREDFGVEIEIDLSPLRPDEDDDGRHGVAAQPMVAGDIRYPTGDLGILLYVKPTLVGDEPPDVAQYARRNDRFPHETTLDQFYDEAQWEAYRKLGEHIANRALGHLATNLRGEEKAGDTEARALTPEQAVRLFLHARYAWPPDGADDPGVTESIERDWTRLECRLEEEGAEALRTELLPSSRERAGKLRDRDLAAALPLVREALRLMEVTILDTGMAARPEAPSHPRYMGWLNRFGRWASTPLFQAWWPWLAPVHSEELREFLHEVFDLPRVAALEGTVRKLDKPDRKGSTWVRWIQSGKPGFAPGLEHFGLFLKMECLPRAEFLAALLAVRIGRPDEAGNNEANTDEHLAGWSRENLFVPPGLWGLGVGERLLRKLIEQIEELRLDPDAKSPWPKVKRLQVASKKADIAWEALYIGAKFQRKGDMLELDLTRDSEP